MDEIKDLITKDKVSAVAVFTKDGIRPLIDHVKNSVKDIVVDASTPKGREEGIALAFQVTKSKTLISKAGKKFTEESRKLIKTVNNAVKIAEEELTALAKEKRKPVTDWEESEAKRIEEERIATEKKLAKIKLAIETIRGKAVDCVGKPSGLIRSTIKRLKEQDITIETFGDLTEEATLARDHVVKQRRTMAESVELQENEKKRLDEERKELEGKKATLPPAGKKLAPFKFSASQEKPETPSEEDKSVLMDNAVPVKTTSSPSPDSSAATGYTTKLVPATDNDPGECVNLRPRNTGDIVPITPTRDAIIIEYIGDRFIFYVECLDEDHEKILSDFAKEIIKKVV
jgi:hypothetical protein